MSFSTEVKSSTLTGCKDRHCYPGELFLQNDPDNIFPKEFYGDQSMRIHPIRENTLNVLEKRLKRKIIGGIRLPTGTYQDESYTRGLADAIEKVQFGVAAYRALCEAFGVINIGTTGSGIIFNGEGESGRTVDIIYYYGNKTGQRILATLGFLPESFFDPNEKFLLVYLMSGRDREAIILEKSEIVPEKSKRVFYTVKHYKDGREALGKDESKDAPVFIVDEGPENND